MRREPDRERERGRERVHVCACVAGVAGFRSLGYGGVYRGTFESQGSALKCRFEVLKRTGIWSK